MRIAFQCQAADLRQPSTFGNLWPTPSPQPGLRTSGMDGVGPCRLASQVVDRNVDAGVSRPNDSQGLEHLATARPDDATSGLKLGATDSDLTPPASPETLACPGLVHTESTVCEGRAGHEGEGCGWGVMG